MVALRLQYPQAWRWLVVVVVDRTEAIAEYPVGLIPDYSESEKGPAQYGVNAQYLADAAKIQKLVAPDSRTGGIKLSFNDGELDPIRIDIESPNGQSAVYVVMPMRI